MPYIGRFAPTPSGRLHLGSICTALGAYLRARNLHGKILLRIEDLDTPRCPKEASLSILEDLKLLGFEFDGPVIYQSQRLVRYQEVLDELLELKRAYFCKCTRQSLKSHSCKCFLDALKASEAKSVRFYSHTKASFCFQDELLGLCEVHNSDEHITLKRADHIFSYNFACVVDDIDEEMTEIVRGSDLIEMTPIQKLLYKELRKKPPKYLHLPLIKMNAEQKFSKQNHAQAALSLGSPCEVLLLCLRLLQQDISFYKQNMQPQEILYHAALGFDINKIPRADVIYTA